MLAAINKNFIFTSRFSFRKTFFGDKNRLSFTSAVSQNEVLVDLKLTQSANQAASGSNAQMARWIVLMLKDPFEAQKRKLADLNRLHGEPYIAADRENPRDDKQRRLLDAVIWQMDHMHEIPARKLSPATGL